MTDPQPRQFTRKLPRMQGTFSEELAPTISGHPKGPHGDQISRLLNRQQVMEEFGLSERAIYLAVQRGQVHAYQSGRGGRLYYAEWELRRLIGLYPDTPLEAA